MNVSVGGSVKAAEVLGLSLCFSTASALLSLRFMRVCTKVVQVRFRIFFLFCAVAVNCSLCEAERQPNILIFLMDDMGYGDLRALNPDGAGFDTPHLDNLLELGVTFTNAHSSASVCAPTRYALLTGNHVYRGRNPGGTWEHFSGSQILHDQQTLADVLWHAGYKTAFFGKSHLGSKFLKPNGIQASGFDDADVSQRFYDGPLDHGFEYSLTLPAGIQSEPYAFFKNDRLVRWNDPQKSWQYFQNDSDARKVFKLTAKKNSKKTAYAMDNWNTESVGPLLMHDALGFIDRHVATGEKDKPFFLYYCSQAGHSPYVPPVSFNTRDPMSTNDLGVTEAIPIAGTTINKRTDMIREGDVSIGLFVKKLKSLGLFQNTLIVFTSDNGAAIGPASSWSQSLYNDAKDNSSYGGDRIEKSVDVPWRVHRNAQGVSEDGSPLRGEKGFVYEGGHRVPLIFCWEGGIRGSRKIQNQMIGLHDLYRTICGLAGIEVPMNQAHDSCDFSEILRSDGIDGPLVRDSLYIQSNRPWEGNKKKIFNTWAAYTATATNGSMNCWKAILEYNTKKKGGRSDARCVELFHLSQDPSEAQDLPEERNRRAALETQFHKMVGDERAIRDD